MNRRTFNKYLLAAPIALATLLTSRPTSSVVRKSVQEGVPYLSKGKWYIKHRGVWGMEIEELPFRPNKAQQAILEELGQKEESIKDLLEKRIKQILIDWDNDFEKKQL